MYDSVSEKQNRRADNQIWNAAGDYSVRPDFKAYDNYGNADIYWNTIIGATRKYYDYPQFEKLFMTLDPECENMFWSAMEKLVYPQEVRERPVLELIREEYDSPLPLHPGMTTEEIVEAANAYFFLYRKIHRKKTHNILGIRKKAVSDYHSFLNSGTMWHTNKMYGSSQLGDGDSELATKMSKEELRKFMETKYGKPMFSPRKTAELEKKLCSGNHKDCHLLFTYGERAPAESIENGFEALSRQREAEQIEYNRIFYQSHQRENHLAITKLADNIQNSILLHLQPVDVKSNTGKFNSSVAWRARMLDDEKVFTHTEQDNMGDFCVDILLDASTSQTNRQETISSQAFIIAESMRLCAIPCRVLSFCSMTGYTILRAYKKNDDIFQYVSNGCNRDGLAIRAAAELMKMERYDHKMLIVLSDVKPNDVVKIKKDEESQPVAYDKAAGLTDTAYEVRRARAEGISVVCIFTGEDEDLSSASMVYGQEYVRIKSFSFLADTVGKLIRNQIKNL